jgi:hypothetical protein
VVVNCHVEIAKGCTDPSMNHVEGGIATPDRRKIAETNDTTRPSPVASPTPPPRARAPLPLFVLW